MKIEIKDFATWPKKIERYEEIIFLIEQGHSVKLFLQSSDFIPTEIFRARTILGQEYNVKEDYSLDEDERVFVTITIENEG
jgi:hypothetical protein